MTSSPGTDPAVVECDAGRITGLRMGSLRRFLGVPYASPPVGARRFALPEAAAPSNVDAGAFGPTPPASFVLPAPFTYPEILGDDWLTLNVWTPAEPDGPLPVLVWFYGGSFAMGSTAQGVFDGAAFARDGVVFVSVNHRVGVEGFAHLPDAPDNRGLHDLVCALEWVRRNIAAFGGDPARVTIAGESAGAMSASALAASPHAGRLFAGAICQSGIGLAYDAETAARPARIAAERLGLAPTADDLRAVDPRTVGRAVADVMAGLPPHRQATLFTLARDGDLVPESPVDVLSRGPAAVPMIIGHNAAEADLWRTPGVFPPVWADGAPDARFAEELALLGADEAVVRAYRERFDDDDAFVELVSDGLFCAPSLRAQRGQAGNCHAYLFTWPSPLLSRTAFHALDLGFALDNLDDPTFARHAGPRPPRALAAAMHGSWVRFLGAGSPGWAPYSTERDVATFGPAESRDLGLLAMWGTRA
ncbi:carboxylesterase family protein [Tsukamurella sp. M9C]|uniref:carboxylesterase/lipase family protein n=1 Tax=unclassified Tsukamurella TaxID=2633480 RepID=UPI001CCC2550|nr:carboxylesterase family protein [Tsukamurella sp. M9C]MCA0158784.1 carboxylesterase family protein [Tsukamurella sp. M9C]